MRHLPVFMAIAGADVLIVGAGHTAAAKARLCAAAQARVIVIAEHACDELLALAETGCATVLPRRFQPDDVVGKALTFAASGDDALDSTVAVAARSKGVPVNVVDGPGRSTFIMPAIIDRDPITVAVSSAGTAPVLAQTVRARIEAILPPRLGRLALFAEAFRDAVNVTFADGVARRRFWQRFFKGAIAEAVIAGDDPAARERMLAAINRRHPDSESGVVVLMSADPTHPDLLTLAALRHLQEADVIVHDHGMPATILDYARRDARRVAVGCGADGSDTEATSGLMLAEVRAGRRVVRVYDFAAGAAAATRALLVRHGIECVLVPAVAAPVKSAQRERPRYWVAAG